MTKRAKRAFTPRRGEIWWVNFNSPASAPTPKGRAPKDKLPAEGDEIYKTRPAVVMNISANWKLKLHIVVPITGWKEEYIQKGYFWMIELPRERSNGLSKDSAADTFEVKSVSITRFGGRLGIVSEAQLDLIAETIAYNIGYALPNPRLS